MPSALHAELGGWVLTALSWLWNLQDISIAWGESSGCWRASSIHLMAVSVVEHLIMSWHVSSFAAQFAVVCQGPRDKCQWHLCPSAHYSEGSQQRASNKRCFVRSPWTNQPISITRSVEVVDNRPRYGKACHIKLSNIMSFFCNLCSPSSRSIKLNNISFSPLFQCFPNLTPLI